MTMTQRVVAVALVTIVGVGGLAGCSSDDGSGGDSADPTTSSAAPTAPSDGSSTDPDPDSDGAESDGAEPAEPAEMAMPDTPVGRYATAVVEATTADAAVGGSPAAWYLEYLATMTELTGDPVGAVGRIDDNGFLLIQGLGRADIVYDDFQTTDLGITDLDLDGRSMSDVVAVVARPIVDPSDIEVLGGYTFTSYGVNRVVVLTLRNGTTTALSTDPTLSSFLETSGARQPGSPDRVATTVDVAPGDTTRVVTVFPRGDGNPNGILEQVFVTPDGTRTVVVVPLGESQPTFFAFGPDGALKGELDADIGFATGSAVPSADGLDILFKASQEILSFDTTSPVCVAGHADSVGDEADNLELSLARAEAVVSALLGFGLTNPIRADGYGEEFAPGDELDDPASRRVEVTVSDCPGVPE